MALIDELRGLVEGVRFVEGVRGGSFAAGEAGVVRGLLDELELLWLESVGEADVAGLGSDRGARSTAAWLSFESTMDRGEAAAHVRFARKLRLMPVTTAAVRDGRLSLSQSRILSRGLTPRTQAVFAESESGLVASAAGLTAAHTSLLIGYWLRAADPDGADRDDRAGEQARGLTVRETLPGTWWIDGRCTTEQAEVVCRAVDSLVNGWLRDSTDTRSVSQMRLDALVELCRQWLTTGDTPTVRDERPHVTLTIDLDQLRTSGSGLLDNGSPVPGEVVSEFVCDCVLTRILSRGSLVLDVGRSERLVTNTQRKAIVKRDRCCRFPGCDRPPVQCDVHHITPWHAGGPTDLSNLVLICRFHHRTLHKHTLRAELAPNAVFRVWDQHGNEMRSQPPPDINTAITTKPRPIPRLDNDTADTVTRQRIRDAITRFQTATTPPTPDELHMLQLTRQRIQALTRR